MTNNRDWEDYQEAREREQFSKWQAEREAAQFAKWQKRMSSYRGNDAQTEVPHDYSSSNNPFVHFLQIACACILAVVVICLNLGIGLVILRWLL